AIYAWLFAADGYVSLFELPEVSLIRDAWERSLTIKGSDKGNSRAIEFTLFGMLLAFMTPEQQVRQLLRRGTSRPQLVSFQDAFERRCHPDTQAQIARLATTEEELLPALWYAVAQEKPV